MSEQKQKTREELLAEAQLQIDKANEILTRFNQLYKDALSLCPVPYLWRDKRNMTKAKSFSSTLNRVRSFERAISILKYDLESKDKQIA